MPQHRREQLLVLAVAATTRGEQLMCWGTVW